MDGIAQMVDGNFLYRACYNDIGLRWQQGRSTDFIRVKLAKHSSAVITSDLGMRMRRILAMVECELRKKVMATSQFPVAKEQLCCRRWSLRGCLLTY